MNDKKQIEVSDEEYEIIAFFRSLTKEKKTLFLSFLESLNKLLKDD